jgi:DNA-binding transcriptional ArsR family regulator
MIMRSETHTLPEDVLASLDTCGGIEGLRESLPPEDTIASLHTLYKTIADPFRIQILVLLAVQPLCVCVIRDILGITDSKLSYHLNVLKENGLIAGEQQGTWIIYRLTEKGEFISRSMIRTG